jgi:hypothetical protein
MKDDRIGFMRMGLSLHPCAFCYRISYLGFPSSTVTLAFSVAISVSHILSVILIVTTSVILLASLID